ncbi:AraC family transcriptional regulator [Thalassomonas viridans]|uniref:AraC family transcriptional regulator n=1 Tax=Thalassomonas viridans TaxID=137584 RepID=A0AAE9Z438_9GAMM|nr:GyrI-like domain-containing protein [Thalassomonas viridans]WDE05664.1 AraC family transcriptional regulator [Thalassomonas viridans]
MESRQANKNMSENNEYKRRINAVLDHLDRHYAQEQNLETLAGIAHFSPYHFHRIFKAVVGESLYKYIQRLRIEKAAHQLKYQRQKSVTAIALDCGFGNPASFARTFKEYFAMSATAWRKTPDQRFSKNCKEQSNSWQKSNLSSMYIDPETNHSQWNLDMLTRKSVTIEIRNLPEIQLAYLRHIGPFKGQQKKWAQLFDRLMTWGAARDLVSCPGTQFFTLFRDDLKITEFEKFKTDVCISVPAGSKSDGEIGTCILPAGKYAEAYFEIDADEYQQAWDILYSDWLPGSGYMPDNRCAFEEYLNDPNQHPQNKHCIKIYIPVIPA